MTTPRLDCAFLNYLATLRQANVAHAGLSGLIRLFDCVRKDKPTLEQKNSSSKQVLSRVESRERIVAQDFNDEATSAFSATISQIGSLLKTASHPLTTPKRR
jgi:hypothetical protein